MIHISQEELFKNIELKYAQREDNNINTNISQGHSCQVGSLAEDCCCSTTNKSTNQVRDMSSILRTTCGEISDKNNNSSNNSTKATDEDEVQAVLITGNKLEDSQLRSTSLCNRRINYKCSSRMAPGNLHNVPNYAQKTLTQKCSLSLSHVPKHSSFDQLAPGQSLAIFRYLHLIHLLCLALSTI